MPPLEQMDLHDPAVLWGYIRTDRNGEPVVAQPVQIMTRWEEGQLEIPRPGDTVLTVDAVIATNRNLALNSIIWEGQLLPDGTYLSYDDVAYPSTGPTKYIYEIVHRVRAKDVKARYRRYEFGLRRYKDRLPTVSSS